MSKNKITDIDYSNFFSLLSVFTFVHICMIDYLIICKRMRQCWRVGVSAHEFMFSCSCSIACACIHT